jgi:hypothetical protein
MTETQTQGQAAPAGEYNPFDSDNFAQGGGLWDGKTVTITSAVAKTELLAYGDGKPVIDKETGQQSSITALFLKGIADGGDDKERHEEYSVGDRLAPAADGRGFVDRATGGPPKFHANSNFAKLAAALKASGFPIGELYDPATRQQRLDRLVGARFVFKAEAKLDKQGKAVKDKKGYTKNTHLPVKFVGRVQGGVGVPQAQGGNGHAPTPGSPADAVAKKAEAAVIGALANGPLSRADLVRTLAQGLAGDPDANAVIGLIVRDDFHKGKAWKYDGQQASL